MLLGILLIPVSGAAENADGIPKKELKAQQAADTFVDEMDDEGMDEAFDDEGFGDEFGSDETLNDVFDPLEGYNRFMTAVNDKLFDYVLDPIFIKGYNFIFPEPVRVSVNNFFNNLYFPVSLVNNLLQLKFQNALDETGRFIVNSTFGFAGLFDPAREGLGIEPHKEDLGQTLGYYGVGGGFHIVLPFFGPSNLRDFTGDLLDFYTNPIYFVEGRGYNLVRNTTESWGVAIYKEFNKISLYEKEYKQLRKDALDLYPFLRDAYEQNRNKLISE